MRARATLTHYDIGTEAKLCNDGDHVPHKYIRVTLDLDAECISPDGLGELASLANNRVVVKIEDPLCYQDVKDFIDDAEEKLNEWVRKQGVEYPSLTIFNKGLDLLGVSEIDQFEEAFTDRIKAYKDKVEAELAGRK